MRIVSGMRPTGKLHVGNLLGALENWVNLQEKGMESFFFVADWHMLTTGYEDVSNLAENTETLVREFLACGIDPKKSVIFVQSNVKEHAELQLLLSMIVPLGRLERIPTYKEQLKELKERNIYTLGFLAYPVLQAADILVYNADGVPVGEDQAFHLEITREIAHKFNSLYSRVFKEPKTLLSKVPKLLGTDGRKMSKSYGNVINIDTNEKELKNAIMPMMTDPARKRRNDPGTPEKCNVWAYHKAFGTPQEKLEEIHEGCTSAKIGCVDCKKILLESMKKKLSPIWEKIDELKTHPQLVKDVIEQGNKKAQAVANETMERVREAMNLYR
ncbi:tryptophan--tRNA ligase [Mesoaciditoga lauensis]|uniref:tryptophan--tRNA ligase n=1 Tax=Mesoaciditoga lauensis TaxID=1495039 RepID=UPI00056BCC10|nr:tryptophan--tRNA ligase [Mesoaciditoga lauensis]